MTQSETNQLLVKRGFEHKRKLKRIGWTKKLLWNCLFLFWRNHLFSFCLSTFHRLVFFWNFSHFAAGKRSWLLYLQKIFLIYSVWPLYRENISIRIDKTSLALDWVYAMVPIPSQIVKMFLWTCSVQYFLLNRQIFELENDTKMLKFHSNMHQ